MPFSTRCWLLIAGSHPTGKVNARLTVFLKRNRAEKKKKIRKERKKERGKKGQQFGYYRT